MSLPDDIIVKAYRAFCAGQRKNDRASLAGMGLFLERVEKGQISHTKARQMLSDDKKIEGIIEKVQAQFEQETRNAQKKKEQAIEQRWERIENAASGAHETTKRVETELSKLHAVTAELQGASKNLIAQTAQAAVTLGAVVKNTSTRTAVIVGFAVGFVAGIPSGMISNYFYERHFSIDAMKDKMPGSAAAPPQPNQQATPPAVASPPVVPALPQEKPHFEIGPNGLCDPTTGAIPNLLELRGNLTITIKQPPQPKHRVRHRAHLQHHHTH